MPDGLLFEFSLPSGAYATVVLREFMKLGDLENTETPTESDVESEQKE
jgi:tRNA(Glu) U13 pseudouridine synthase TruD